MVLETFLTTLTTVVLPPASEACFSYLLESLPDHMRAWLSRNREPADLAFQTALLHTIKRFADNQTSSPKAIFPTREDNLISRLLHFLGKDNELHRFFTHDDVVEELSRFLTGPGTPDPQPQRLVTLWAAQFPDVSEDERRQAEAETAIAEFLRMFKEELHKQEALRPLFDSYTRERIAADLKIMREQHAAALREAERSLRILMDIYQAVKATSVRPLPTKYDTQVQDFLDEYLGEPEYPVPFGGRKQDLANLSAWLEDEDAPPYLLLTAPAGRGKSALLTRWFAALQKRTDLKVVFVPISIRFGTNLPTVAFAILATQLAEIYGKKPPEKDETPEMWRGFVSDTLRQPPPDGKRVVVVVDGLDEVADWKPGPGLFPARPGERVRVVVSARLTATRPTSEDWRRTLGWEGAHRARAMTLEGLTQQGIAEVLASMGVSLDQLGRRADIVAELHRLTEGDPLLVRLYVDDLWAQGEAVARLQPEDLRDIQPGYAGYFQRWWEDQRKLWGKESPLKERAVREVLNLLACALGPLTQDDLLALVDPKADLDPWTLKEALEPIARFVVGDRKRGYSLTHPKLGEYFREEMLGSQAQAIEARFAKWARKTGEALRNGHLQPEDTPRYLLEYASVHLTQADAFDDLAGLIENPAWYIASERHDPSCTLFAADVERALALAEARVLEKHRLDYLPHVVAWSLLHATVRTLATNVPVEALEAMVLLGDADRALRYAALITGPKQQAEAYRRIGARLHEQGKTEQARDVLRQALTAAQAIESERWRAEALSSVAQALAQVGDREGALTMVQAIEDGWQRAKALAMVAKALAQVGDQEGLQKASGMALKIEGGVFGSPRSKALAAVAHALAQTDDRATLQKTLEAILKVEDNLLGLRAKTLAAVAPAFAQIGDREGLQKILEAVLKAENTFFGSRVKAEALTVVAQALIQIDDWKGAIKALTAALEIAPEDSQTQVLVTMAQAFLQSGDLAQAHEALQQALTSVQAILDEDNRIKALTEVTKILAQIGDREGALAAAQAIEDESTRVETLSSVAQILAQVSDREGALAAAQAIEDESTRVETLSSVAQILAQVGDRDGAQLVLAAAQEVRNEDARAKALATMASMLVQMGETNQARQMLQQALAAPQAVHLATKRAQILAIIAIALAQVEQIEQSQDILQQALTVAREIKDDLLGSHVRGLIAVAHALAQVGEIEQSRNVLQRAFIVSQTIEIQWVRAEVLAAIAIAFNKVGERERAHQTIQESFTTALTIDYTYDRDQTIVNITRTLAQMEGRETHRLPLIATWITENELTIAELSAAIAHTLAQLNDLEGLLQILAVIRTIQSKDDQADALAAVSHALAQVRNREGLLQILAASQVIENERARAKVLVAVAQAFVQIGEVELAQDTLRQTLETVQTIRDDPFGSRAKVLAAAAEILVHMGKIGQARQTLQQALADAQTISYAIWRTQTLAAVANVLTQMKETQKAQKVLQWALKSARKIRNKKKRIQALFDVVQALAQVGDWEGALAAAKAIKWEQARAYALSAVAQALAQVGDREGLKQALGVAEAIEGKRWRAEALSAVAQALTQVGEMGTARQAVQQALAAAQAIKYDDDRAEALSAVAQALAQVTKPQDREVTGWLVGAFRWARARGRAEVWRHIHAFAPVLAKLEVISETWQRIQTVEAVVRR